MRLSSLIVALAVAAPIGLAAGSASAQFFEGQSVFSGRSRVYQGRWCAYINSGADRVEEDCHFDSFKACRREAGTGSSNFCAPNPGFTGYHRPPPRKKKRRHR